MENFIENAGYTEELFQLRSISDRKGYWMAFSGIISPASKFGEVPEWLNGTVSKTVVGFVSTEGSNPSLSAKESGYVSGSFSFI